MEKRQPDERRKGDRRTELNNETHLNSQPGQRTRQTIQVAIMEEAGERTKTSEFLLYFIDYNRTKKTLTKLGGWELIIENALEKYENEKDEDGERRLSGLRTVSHH